MKRNTPESEQAVEIQTLAADPTPEALQTLHEKYGLVIGRDGHLYKASKRLDVRGAVDEAVETSENVASKVSSKARKAGRMFMAYTADTASAKLQTAKRQHRVNKAERLAEKERWERERAEQKAQEKAEKEAAQRAAEEAIARQRGEGHTTAS